MKRLTFIGLVAAVALVGCSTIPSENTMRLIGRAGGAATGLILAQCDIDTSASAVITNIVANIGGCVPEDGETLQEAWTRTAQEHTDILVARGDLTAQQGAMVMSGFRLVVSGYDLLLVYYPEVGTYAELTTATVDGFSEGFLAAYAPGRSNGFSSPVPDARVFRDLKASREFKMLKKGGK